MEKIPLVLSNHMTVFILLSMVSVALFIPNIIGYIRAITGILSFYFVDSNPRYKLIVLADL